MRRITNRPSHFFGLAAIAIISSVLTICTDAGASSVQIVSPKKGQKVSGSVPITTSMGSQATWVNIYIDGVYYQSTPPSAVTWSSTGVRNGAHTISARAYASRPNRKNGQKRPPKLLQTVSTQVTVDNSASTPSPTPTVKATPTRTATATPIRTSTPTPVSTPSATGSATHTATPGATPTPSGTAYYFSTTGSDSSPCSSSAPCWSLPKAETVIGHAKPGDSILFARGEKWTGGITLPTHVNGASGKPITIGNYGSGALPIIDGGDSAPACFYARGTGGGTTPLWSYLTIDGFECRNATEYGVVFYQNQGGSLSMPGIVVQNMNIHNTGPSSDDGNYRNQLMFLDENKGADGVQFLNNSVTSCGGHNCIQIQMDTGSPVISGNYCQGWIHNCIDVKAVVHAMVKNNIVSGAGASGGAAFYLENTEVPNADVTWQRNVVYGAPNGFECEWGGNGGKVTSTCRVYNNTAYLGDQSAIVTGGDPSCGKVTLDVRNNILDSTSLFYDGHSCTTPTWDYNDNGASRGSVGGPSGPHDLDGVNPMYVSAPANNYRLATGSPCIAKGVAGLSSGINNIGAY